MYKRTKLNHQAWQMACLNNLYDNFCRSEGINEATVRSQADVEKLLTKMFLKYGIHFYWDPDRVDPLADHPCDLMRHCRDQVICLTDLRPRQAHLRGRGGNKQGQKQKLSHCQTDADTRSRLQIEKERNLAVERQLVKKVSSHKASLGRYSSAPLQGIRNHLMNATCLEVPSWTADLLQV